MQSTLRAMLPLWENTESTAKGVLRLWLHPPYARANTGEVGQSGLANLLLLDACLLQWLQSPQLLPPIPLRSLPRHPGQDSHAV